MPALATDDGRVLSYRQVGEGPTLVCHGGGPGFSSLYLGRDLAGLGRDFRLIMLDPRGTGGSSRPSDPRAYALQDYVADLERLREHIGEPRMLLFGHSHGGVVTQLYAARFPERVRALILASTLARFHTEQRAAMEEAMAQRSAEPWYPDAVVALEAEQAGRFSTDEELTALVLREMPFYFASFGEAERDYLRALSDEVLNADTLRFWNDEIFESFDTRPELPAITAPTLVIYGSRDFITGPACAEEIVTGIPRAERVVVEGAGHTIFVDTPAAFRRAVTAFVERATRTG